MVPVRPAGPQPGIDRPVSSQAIRPPVSHRRPVAPSPSSKSAAASRGRTSRYHGIAALFSTAPSHSARGRQRQHTGGLDKLESDGSELYEYTADFDRLVIRIREDCFDEPSDDLPKDDPDHDVIEKSLS